MKLKLKCTLIKSVKQEPFQDSEGKWIEYSKNWLEVDEDIVLMTSGKDYSSLKDVEGVATVNARPADKLWKLSLTDFEINETGTIEF